MNKPLYKNSGYILNIAIDLDFTYFNYLFRNHFHCVFFVPENKNDFKKTEFVFFQDVLGKFDRLLNKDIDLDKRFFN